MIAHCFASVREITSRTDAEQPDALEEYKLA